MSHPPSPKPIAVVANEIEAVLKWTSTDETREHLHYVAFRDDEYIATDGHRLVRVPCTTRGQSFSLHRDHLRCALAAFRVQRTSRFMDLNPVGPLIDNGVPRAEIWVGPETNPQLMRCSLPMSGVADVHATSNVAKVTKGAIAGQPLHGHWIDPKYLAAVAEVHAADGGDGHDIKGIEVVACSTDRKGPIVFRNGKGITFVIMPLWNQNLEQRRK